MKTQMPPVVSADKPLRMVGCGILRDELNCLIRKNGWNVEPVYLDSALHNYLGKLATQLDTALKKEEEQGNDTLVFYGCCHPQIDGMMQAHQTVRTQGQNCIVMLLGYEHFMQELEQGAYFLLEDWARTWEPMIRACFGNNVAVIREIFHSSHKFVVAIRTPCSGDFTEAAEAAAAFIDLPLRWMEVDLGHLERVLADAIEQKQTHVTGS